MKTKTRLKKIFSLFVTMGLLINNFGNFGFVGTANAEITTGDPLVSASVLKGNFEINPDGSGNYTLPIAVMPGINGMEPKISIKYNSSNIQNGVLGIGFSLAGLSLIGRGGPNKYIDGNVGPITNTNTDGFYLDGQRLIAVDGDNGMNGTKYRTEIESWVDVEGVGVFQAFKIRTKDGMTMEYGTTVDSTIWNYNPSALGIDIWLLKKATDINGNSYEITYGDNGEGQYYPTLIEYGKNNQCRVEFTYEEREDDPISYASGTKIKITKRLKSISTKFNTTLIKKYECNYAYTLYSRRSMLTSITLSDGSDNTLEPVEFTWANPNEVISFEDQNIISWWEHGHHDTMPKIYADVNGDSRADYIRGVGGASPEQSSIWVTFGNANGFYNAVSAINSQYFDWGYDDKPRSFTDVNGDGRTDYMRIGGVSNSYYYTSTLGEEGGSGYNNMIMGASGYFPEMDYLLGYADLPRGYYDVNGDGKTEEFVRGAIGGANWQTAPIFTTNPNTANPYHYNYSDYLPFDWGYDDKPRSFADINGDGCVDYVRVVGSTNLYLAVTMGRSPGYSDYYNGQEYPYRINGDVIYGPSIGHAQIPRVFADFNNDGMADYIRGAGGEHFNTAPVMITLGTNRCFENKTDLYEGSEVYWAHKTRAAYDPGHDPTQFTIELGGDLKLFTDVNGDGLLDFVRADIETYEKDDGYGCGEHADPGGWEKGHLLVTFGTDAGISDAGHKVNVRPTNFDFGHKPYCGPREGRYRQFADINGDGVIDFVRAPASAKDGLQVSVGGCVRNKIIEIKDGINQKTEIEYAPLTRSDVYTKSTGASYPIKDIQAPMYVVSEYKIKTVDPYETNNILENNYTLKYEGLKQDVEKRKSLGFAKIILKDTNTNRETITTYNQDYPYNGKVANIVTEVNDKIISKDAMYYESGLTNGIYDITVSSTVESVYSLHTTSSTFDYAKKTVYEYDTYNNITKETIYPDCSNEDGTGYTASKVVHTVRGYINDDTNWKIGFLENEKINSDGVIDFTEWKTNDLSWTQYEYDDNMVSEEKQWNNEADEGTTSPNWLTKKKYTYDDYGNITNIEGPTPTGSTYGTSKEYVIDAGIRTYVQEEHIKDTSGTARMKTQYTYGNGKYYGLWTKKTVYDGVTSTIRLVIERIIDGFGNITEEKLTPPDGGTAETITISSASYAMNGNNVVGIVTEKKSRVSWDDDWAWEKEYKDGRGLVFRKESKGPDGKTLVEETKYDKEGKVIEKTQPYYSGDTPSWAYYTYDDKGMVTQITQAGITRTISKSWDSNEKVYSVTKTNTNTAISTCLNIDTAGNAVKRIDADGTTTTEFEYNLLNRNTKVIAPNGSIDTVTYDSLGNKIFQYNVDMGTTTFVYKVDGSFFYKKDAKGQKEQYYYDNLGRLSAKFTKDSGNNFKTKVVYNYNSDNGKVSYSRMHDYVNGVWEDPKIEYSYYYDKYDNVIKTEFEIEDMPAYIFEYDYNTSGKMKAATYPDNSLLSYEYHDNGALHKLNLKDAENGVRQIGVDHVIYSSYTALGQPEKIAYANGVESDYTYDIVLSSHVMTDGSTVLLDRSYSWDNNYNITQITDNDTQGYNETQSFTYNDLGRLTQATASDTYGTKTYEYNAEGSITEKDGMVFTEFTGHKVTKGNKDANGDEDYNDIGETDYFTATYDANGNMTQKVIKSTITLGVSTTWDYTYDEKDKLIKVEKDSDVQSEYMYDQAGRRVKSVNYAYDVSLTTTTTKWYVSEQYEVVKQEYNGQVTNYEHTKFVDGLTGHAFSITKKDEDVILLIPAGIIATKFPNLYNRFNALVQWSNAYITSANTMKGMVGVAFMMSMMLLGLVFIRRRKGMIEGLRLSWTANVSPIVLFFMLMTLAPLPANAGPWPSAPRPGLPDTGAFYYHQDNIHTSSIVTDDTGTVRFRGVYDPYGTLLRDKSYGLDEFIPDFTGQNYDDGSEMYYYKARYYDSMTGRFITADTEIGTDPIFHRDAFNRYAYVAGNPIKYIDPSGHIAFCTILLICVIVGGVVAGAGYSIACATSGREWSAREFGIAIGIGAAAGLVAGLTGGAASYAMTSVLTSMAAAGYSTAACVAAGVAMGAVGGAAAGVAGQATANALYIADGQDVNMEDGLWEAAVIGGALGAVAGGFQARGAVGRQRGINIRKANISRLDKEAGNIPNDPQGLKNADAYRKLIEARKSLIEYKATKYWSVGDMIAESTNVLGVRAFMETTAIGSVTADWSGGGGNSSEVASVFSTAQVYPGNTGNYNMSGAGGKPLSSKGMLNKINGIVSNWLSAE